MYSATCIKLTLLIVVAVGAAWSQTVSLSLSGGSGAPGASVTVGVGLSSSGGAQPAAVQWDLLFVSSDLSPVSGTYYATGGAASAAGKSATCNLVSPGDIRCIVAGFNTTAIGNGSLATVTLQIAAGTTNTSSVVSLSGLSASDGSGASISASGTGATITINQPVPTLSNLTCAPASLTPPATSSCTVNLSGAVASSTSVALTSGSASVSVPPSVTVSAGASSAGFTANAPAAVSANGSALLTASLSGVSVNFTLALNAPGGPPVLSNLTCTPASLTPPGTASCTVSLSGAATGSTIVSLSSGNPSVTVPPSVTIGSGASSIGFTANVPAAVSANSSAMLTASLNGNSRNFSLGLTTAQVTQPGVSSLVCSPSTVAGGSNSSCTVYLTGSAPSGGTPVSLSSNNSNAMVPSQVTVPAGLSSASFAVSTLAVTSTQTPVVSASSSGATQTATLTLQTGGASLASLSCTPGAIATTSSANCTVSLTGNAPAGGLTVTLTSDSVAVTVPANVLVPAGSSNVGFSATAGTPVTDLTAMLTATMNGAVTTFPVSVLTSANVALVSCIPASIAQGSSSTCSLTLNKTASGAGVGVTLASSSPKVAVPGSVTIPAGSNRATFTASAASDAGNISDTITATTTTVARTAVLNVYQPLNATLVCTPTTIQTPGTGTCTLTLSNPAQASTSVSLLSSSASLTMPTTVTIGTGMTSATFSISAASIPSSTTASISAAGNVAQSVTLLAAQNSAPATISCGPQTLTGAGQAACTLTLPAPAPAGGMSIALSSSSTQLTVPTVVQVPQGNLSAAFNATASTINYDESATITATLQNSSVQAAVSLVSFKPLAIGCTPKPVNAGSPVSCQVTLSAAATSNGVALRIGTSNAHIAPPSSVPVPPGQSEVTFQAATSGLTQKQTGVIIATFGSYSVQDTITIAVAPPALIVPGPQSARPGKTTAFTVAANDPAGMAVTLSVLDLPQTATFDAASGVFTWVPPASQIGGHTVQFTATNTSGASSSKNVFVNVGSDTPVILSFANAASYVNDGGCSPGAVATFLGEGFANTVPKSAATSPIPTEVNGVRVKANGDYIPVFYASETQINVQCPQLAPGNPLTLTVESTTGASSPLSTKVQYATPGIFSLDGSGRGQGAILLANTPTVAMPHTDGIPSQPAKPGGFISIYATGLGPVGINLPAGQPAPTNVLVPATAPIDVRIDGLNAEVAFAGLAPAYAGLFQVNAKVPASIHTGDAVPVQILTHRPDGSIAQSNVVTIAVAAPN